MFFHYFHFGAKDTPIGIGETVIRCPRCRGDHMADIMVISRYYHIYWIPMFPFEKMVSTTCQKCGMFRSGLYFNHNLVSNYHEIKRKFRHPWFTYTGAGIVSFMLMGLTLTQLFTPPPKMQLH